MPPYRSNLISTSGDGTTGITTGEVAQRARLYRELLSGPNAPTPKPALPRGITHTISPIAVLESPLPTTRIENVRCAVDNISRTHSSLSGHAEPDGGADRPHRQRPSCAVGPAYRRRARGCVRGAIELAIIDRQRLVCSSAHAFSALLGAGQACPDA